MGVSAYFVSVIGEKDVELSGLDSQLNAKNVEVAELTSQVASLSDETARLSGELTNLTDSIKLNVTEVWLDDEAVRLRSGEVASWNRTVPYAGYLSIDQVGGGSNQTGGDYSVQVTYSSGPVYFDQKYVLGKSMPQFGGLNFPLLPTSNLELRVGYDNVENSTADIRLTASYVH